MVHFVGAGSGAVDLITVRGAKLLSECDVVIYAGSLVNPDLLSYCKKDCKIYNSATMTLEPGHCCHRGSGSRRKTTVRLHTGDSSIYGAVREQFDELDQAGHCLRCLPRRQCLLRCRRLPENRVHPAGREPDGHHHPGPRPDPRAGKAVYPGFGRPRGHHGPVPQHQSDEKAAIRIAGRAATPVPPPQQSSIRPPGRRRKFSAAPWTPSTGPSRRTA